MFNASYIVNYPTVNGRNFGCKRRCEYCNWRRLEDIDSFTESFPDPELGKAYRDPSNYSEVLERITISGGGDPLFNPTNNPGYIPTHTIKLIRQSFLQGYKTVRIITREIETADHLINNILTDSERNRIEFSISLDFRSLADMESNHGIAILPYVKEFTYVPNAVPDLSDLAVMAYRLNGLLEETNMGQRYLTIRENLRSTVFMAEKDVDEHILEPLRKLGNNNIKYRWLPKFVCLNNIIYLIQPMAVYGYKDRLRGWRITPDFDGLARFFSRHEGTILYGGAVRQMVAQMRIFAYPLDGVHHSHSFEFSDYDVFVDKDHLEEVKRKLEEEFEMEEVKDVNGKRITYATKIDPTFKVVLYVVDNLEIAWDIISQANVGFDRIGAHEGTFVHFKGFNLMDLTNGIARELPHKWKHMDKEKRKRSEERHLKKLASKHFTIVKMGFFGRIHQWIIDKFC